MAPFIVRCGIDVSHKAVRFWWNRFGGLFNKEIRRRRCSYPQSHSVWGWHVDELFVKINGEQHSLWRAIDREGEGPEAVVTKRRNKAAALKPLGICQKQVGGRCLNNRIESSHLSLRRREHAMKRIRRFKTLQKFTAVHAAFQNHFNLERSQYRRQQFKANRVQTIAEWRDLLVA